MSNHYAPPQAEVADLNPSGAAGITEAMLDAMRGTKPWVLLIGIVLVISAVFMFLGTLGMIGAGMLGAGNESAQAGVVIAVGLLYALMGAVYIMMGVYLFKYSSAIGRLLLSARTEDMEDALVSQRKFWKIAGIITIVMLILMVVGFVAAISIPMLSMSR